MEKVKIDRNAFVYPMPMTLIGALVEDKPNFLAAAWVTRVNMKPPMIAVALGGHYTNKGIDAKKVFSVNIPDTSLIEKTDYCGIVSGATRDKSTLFDVFYGELKDAPLIRECPIAMSCRVLQSIDLPADTLYIGEIVEVFSEDRYLTDGIPDIKKINPFTLSMPDNHYWGIGEVVGRAWQAGKKLK
jgi:flavin reductase (DIM6/NTAB) family NADH-FMN oxidoreductase RutF